ncbi:hypothetical protein [Prevotella sp. P3-92]|nr:hypothetical protein [Prevotella sp. P3-92]
MKKYILPFMSIAMLMAMASCSSSDDEVAEIKEESKLVPMTFTATQESNVGTRTALDAGTGVDWETGDKISVFDGQGNRTFTLTEDVEDGKFSGTASSQATSFTAVYPYTEGAKLEKDGSVSGITLPAEQTPTIWSFDPKAALMMAVSTKDKKYNLDFKNAVSLIKLQIEFPCKKIVLTANEDIAGTGTLTYNNGEPSISFTSNQSKTITLKPATGEYFKKGDQYFIVVPPITLTKGFSISFHASDEYCVYTRTSTKSNTFHRSKFKHIGKFETTGIFDTTGKKLGEWTYNSRGIVDKSQELDMGEFDINGKKYRLIFAKSNLTKDGLATNEYDYGDYFAWGATEPWYSSATQTWKNDKPGGYIIANAPYYDISTRKYTKYTTAGQTLEDADDAARQILKGDWQIPTKEIWEALDYAKNNQVYWGPEGNRTFTQVQGKGINGIQIIRNDRSGKYLFLPAAGYVYSTDFKDVGSIGYYWSATAYTNDRSYNLYCDGSHVYHHYNHFHYNGLPVRPVRLVAVD